MGLNFQNVASTDHCAVVITKPDATPKIPVESLHALRSNEGFFINLSPKIEPVITKCR